MVPTQRLILADDLTGCNDTGVHLLSDTESVTVVVRSDADVSSVGTANVVVNTDTRFMNPTDAYAAIQKIYESLPISKYLAVYKKIDSTLRGNIGSEIDALFDIGDYDVVCLTPAGPRLGRTVINGECFVHGEPLAETEIARDPFHPIQTSNISDILSMQSRRRVGNLSLESLRKQHVASSAIEKLIGEGCEVIVADTVIEEDLKVVLDAFELSGKKVLYAGAAGMFDAMFKNRSKPKLRHRMEHDASGTLIAVGSLMPRSHRQLNTLVECNGVHVGILSEDSVIEARESTVTNTISGLLETLNYHGIAALKTQPSESVSINQPEQMSVAMGQVIRGILANRSLEKLVLVGGDTALGVLNELGISSLELMYEALPGVAAAEAVLPDGRVQAIITKSGSYGDDDVFCRLLEGVNVEA